MPKMIFVNLPVGDVAASTAFYEALGFTKNDKFSNEQAASLMWSDAIVVMVLAKPFFASMTEKQIADARTSTGALISLSLDSRDQVDAINRLALSAGGRELHGAEDMGFMYSRAFEDLDGHGWGVLWMDPDAAQNGPPQHQPAAA